MNETFDEAVKECLALRQSPPSEVKASLHERLLLAEKRRQTRCVWFVLVYAVLLSAAMVVLMVTLTNSLLLLVPVVTSHLLLALGGTILITVCRKSDLKGGSEDVLV